MSRLATPAGLARLRWAPLLLLNLVFWGLFQMRNARLQTYAACPDPAQCPVLPDGSLQGYSGEQLAGFMQSLGASGRLFYALSELSLDLLYPLVYGALLAAVLCRLVACADRRFWLAPILLGMLFDWLENALLATIALALHLLPQLAGLASVATQAKFLCLGGVLATLVWGIFRRVR